MSGMAIKFTSLAQIEANQFVPEDDRLCLGEAGGLSLREMRTGRSTHYRIYQLDSAGHILAGHSIVCQSDAEAMDAACRFAEQAAAVEVWEGTRRIGCLSTAVAARRDRGHIRT